MEVILLQDVKALGKKGQKVNVSEGYARNFILPKKLGIEVNAKNMNDLKLQKAHEDKLAAEALANAKELAKELEDIDKKKMVLNDAIKALGNYEVVCKLHKDVTAKLVVKVTEG